MGLLGLLLVYLFGRSVANDSADKKEAKRVADNSQEIVKYYDQYLNNVCITGYQELNRLSKFYHDPGGFFSSNDSYDSKFPYIDESFAEEEDPDWYISCPEGAVNLNEICSKYCFDRSSSYYDDREYSRYYNGEHEFLASVPNSVLQTCSSYVQNRVRSLIKDFERVQDYFKEQQRKERLGY